MYSTCLYDIIAALQLAAVIIFCRRHTGNRCVPSYLHSIRYHGALSDRYQIELIYLLVVLALGIFSDADLGILTDGNVLRHDRLIHNRASADRRALHDDRITDHRTFSDRNACSDDRVNDFAVYLGALADDTALYLGLLRYKLWGNNIALRVNLPVFFIQVELRNDVDQ